MMTVALLGAGGHSAGSHAPALQQYSASHPSAVRLGAVCDLNPGRAAALAHKFGFARAVAHVEDLFGPGPDRPDVLVAVLPIEAMAATTPGLFGHGIPLLIEKPLGRSLTEAEALVAAAIHAGATDRVMVSLNRRYDPAVTHAARWLVHQPRPRYVRATMTRSQRTEPDFVWGTGVHLIDALQHLLGPLQVVPESVTCPGGCADAARIARLTGRGPVEVLLEILPTAGAGEESIRFIGDEYQIDVHLGSAPPWRVRAQDRSGIVLDEQAAPGEPSFVVNGTAAETAAFLDAVVSGRARPQPDLAAALASSRLAARIASPG